MSGYDFMSSTGKSQGTESGNDDCTPLVYDRCDATNQTRDAAGNCVFVTDCASQCNGGTGLRSSVLGICTCDDKVNVDVICNQNCRSSASKLTLNADGTLTLIKNGNSTVLELSSLGDVYGSTSCSTANCSIKSTEMGSDSGFYGTYGASSLIEAAASKRLLSDDHYRLLATSQVSTTSIKNPVICINTGDSMMFTITSPAHYPVYLKDSVLNSNPAFDYGAFLVLATQMTYKSTNNNTDPSFFSFTFTSGGTYLFTDSSDSSQLLLLKVAATGESCADSDRYIQQLSADAAASVGTKQKTDIIIKPDVPLIVMMSASLVLAVAVVMIGIGYCLHKGWTLRKITTQGYRKGYFKVDIDH